VVSHSESSAAVRKDRSATATPDRARIRCRRYPLHRSHRWEGLSATLLSPATGLLRYAVAAYRQCFISGRGSIWNSHKHRPLEHIGFAIFAIEAAGVLVRGVFLRRLITQAALRARKHDRGLCYCGHPAILRRWLAGSIRYCPGFEGTRAPNV